MTPPRIVVVGATTHSKSRILACFELPRGAPPHVARLALRVPGAAVRVVQAALLPADPYVRCVFEVEGLPPETRIEHSAWAEPVGAPAQAPPAAWRAFRTLPAPDGRPVRYALVSCNGAVFAPQEGQRVMWARLQAEIDAGRVDVVVHAGDQVYADAIWQAHDSDPALVGLLPGTPRARALRAAYRRLYVHTWGFPEVAGVLGSCPSLMMWDDHEIFDGFGSNDEDDAPAQRAFFDAANLTFGEFQRAHGPASIGPSSHACAFVHGATAVLLLDARQHRLYKAGRVLGDAQLREVDQWFDRLDPGVRHLFVVLGVPVFHAHIAAALSLMEGTPWTEATTDDLRDSWVSEGNRAECDRLLLRLFGWPGRRRHPLCVTVLSGDVHTATLARLSSRLPEHATPAGSPGSIYQVVSSGIGTPPPSGLQALAIQAAQLGSFELGSQDLFTGELLKVSGFAGRAIFERNFAVISLDEGAGSDAVKYPNVRVTFHKERTGTSVHRLVGER